MISYFVLAVWTYGIQVPSGLFVPGIIIGCSFGRLAGEWVRYFNYDARCGVNSNTDVGTRTHLLPSPYDKILSVCSNEVCWWLMQA
eukprot:COSAG05_NODE_4044_length_1703_cov_1.647756_3_plen_86_part_00